MCETPTDSCLVSEIVTIDDDRRKYFGRIELFDRGKNFLFSFFHELVGAPSSARSLGRIELRKLLKMYFLPKNRPTYVKIW